MAFKNFAYSTVVTAPSPADSGTSVTVVDADVFPAPPFNATVWPAAVQPLASNAEIVRVTAAASNTFTITREQEDSDARSIIAGDQIAATVTAKTLTDLEASANVAQAFSLTAAQLKASTLTPHTIIAAQGADTLVIPTAWAFRYTPGVVPFTAEAVDLVYGDDDLSVIFTGLGLSALVGYAFGTQSAGIAEFGADSAMLNKDVKLAANLLGSIVATTGGAGGTGYAVGDTGTIDDGSPDATYQVTSIGAFGLVLAFTVTSGGGDYALGLGRTQTEWTTTPGGAQPGSGDGEFVVNVTAVDASASAGDGTLSGVVYYTVADLS